MSNGNNPLVRIEHKIFIENKRRKLKNDTPSIISNNCIGGIISHDLGIKFNSPCVNQGMIARDYIKFLKNMDHYLALTPEPLDTMYRDTNFMMTKLGDIICLFAHEKSIDIAISKWENRKSRIDKSNMYVLMADSLECTYNDISDFASLPFKNKVIFTHKPYPDIECAYYIKGFEDKNEVGVLSDYKPGFWKRRYIDDFDYVKFLNTGSWK